MSDARQHVNAILNHFQDDCLADDVQYSIDVVEKLHRRIKLANDPDQSITQIEAESRVAKWLLK